MQTSNYTLRPQLSQANIVVRTTLKAWINQKIFDKQPHKAYNGGTKGDSAMGQYHRIINLDEKVKLDPYTFGGAAKLCEQCGVGVGSALMYLLATYWKGNHISVVGDYAEEGMLPKQMREHGATDYDFYPDTDHRKNWWMKNMLNECIGLELHKRGIKIHDGKKSPGLGIDGTKKCILANLDKKEFIAFGEMSLEEICLFDTPVISAAMTLLACSNGLGGGDFRNSTCDEIGSWSGDRLAILGDDEADEWKKSAACIDDKIMPILVDGMAIWLPPEADKTLEMLPDNERSSFVLNFLNKVPPAAIC